MEHWEGAQWVFLSFMVVKFIVTAAATQVPIMGVSISNRIWVCCKISDAILLVILFWGGFF